MKPLNVPTIPVDVAVERVTLFRERMTKSADVPQNAIPRAVLIPIDDLLAIVSKYTTTDDEGKIVSTIQGVRAYFSIAPAEKDLPDPITALIVPVNLQGNDIIHSKGYTGGDDSDIYDFTKPCPDQCDPESPLYVP
ncbi:hypothetical protein D9M68_676170 [compost metagenome]